VDIRNLQVHVPALPVATYQLCAVSLKAGLSTYNLRGRARKSPKRGDWHQSNMKLAIVSQWVTSLSTERKSHLPKARWLGSSGKWGQKRVTTVLPNRFERDAAKSAAPYTFNVRPIVTVGR
jgi:hypothetical protein